MSENYYYKNKEARLKYQKKYNEEHKEEIEYYQFLYYMNHRYKNTRKYQYLQLNKVNVVPSIKVKLDD